jgi:hypothetical protein
MCATWLAELWRSWLMRPNKKSASSTSVVGFEAKEGEIEKELVQRFNTELL